MIGKFITIDGIEGVGKSTQMTFVYKYLSNKNIKVCKTREPGGSIVGDKIRNLLLVTDLTMSADTELMLMFASRCEHITKTIKPALAQGEWVLSDRFSDASFAYQGNGRGIDMTRIKQLSNWVQQDFEPDLSFFLDAPVDIAMSRVNNRGNKDRFEVESIDFFERIRSGFLQIAKLNPHRVVLINANDNIDAVSYNIKTSLDNFLNDN